jgi:ribosomal protein S18 acetylase RimI-like enzyme
MSGVTIRPATGSDIPSLRRLYDEFHAFHARHLPDRLLIPAEQEPNTEFEDAIDKILANNDAMLLVAQEGDEVVGFAEIYVHSEDRRPWAPPRRYGHLQSLGVTQRMRRRRGVGGLLLQAAERWAVGKDAGEIRTDVWEFGEGPLGFYERAGYMTLRRTLVRPISPN